MSDPRLRRLLFEKDKQQGMSQPYMNSSPNSIQTSHPSQMSGAPKAFKLGAPSAPKFNAPSLPSVGHSIQPTAAPSLPGLNKMPKFGRVKKYLKGPI